MVERNAFSYRFLSKQETPQSSQPTVRPSTGFYPGLYIQFSVTLTSKNNRTRFIYVDGLRTLIVFAFLKLFNYSLNLAHLNN